jgi:death-on-curing protein
MKKPPLFLTVEQVCSIHKRMIAEFGGDPEMRDRGLLESAVAMPAAKFGNLFLHKSLPEMAAAYLFHICKNYAFLDGNKRTALAAAEMFLILNGRRLNAPEAEVECIVLGVADGSIGKQALVKLFRRFVKKDNR